jgi:hypothetical protein
VSASNPFDPDEIEIDAEFFSPTGRRLRVPAFVTQDYERQLVDGREELLPLGDLVWKVRFTPDEEGDWTWSWVARMPDDEEAGGEGRFTVAAAEIGSRGFVRVAEDGRSLRFDDGTPWLGVGENLSWYDGRGTYAYDTWMARIAAEGGNYIRVWMPSWAFSLETTLGDYRDRLDRAWQLDHVFELARLHGIQVMLSIQNHGPFSLTFNSEWEGNPYNATNGGPLVLPEAFFTDDTARELFRRRLRYIVGRWAHSPELFALELWNEVDLAEKPPIDDVLSWHREMGGELARLDPWNHLVTTSTGLTLYGLNAAYTSLWELDEIDLVQGHRYGFGLDAPIDFVDELPAAAKLLEGYGKPFLFAEVGVDSRGGPETLLADPAGEGFHDLLWAGIFSGAVGTGMAWWWDSVRDPEDQYFHFGPISQLLRPVDFGAEGSRTETLSVHGGDRPIDALGLVGRSTILVWINDRGHSWFSPDPVSITGAMLEVSVLSSGPWTATWIDTRSGEETIVTGVQPENGVLFLSVPEFSRDVALRLETPE